MWRARLRWARAVDSIDEARRTLAHLPADRFSPTEVLSLRAWFAARLGRAETEQTALEQVIDQAPGDTQTLERLAALATELGQLGTRSRSPGAMLRAGRERSDPA